jgi:Starch-binding associating with outer membrane
MINSKILRVGTGLAFALAAAACNSDKLTNLNKNPNSPEDVPAGPLFTNASRVAVARWLGAGYDLRQTEWVAQHLAEVQYNDEDRYLRLHAGDTEGNFNNAYSGELKDLTQIITKGTDAKAPGTYAPAQALRTWEFSYLTNTWGDVPYFTALTADAGGSLSPSYDKQKDIYDDFFKVLAKATTDLTGAANTLGSADPIYAGSVTKWQKFINSLRLRLALTLINQDPTTAQAQLQAAFNAPGGPILTNADNAVLVWPGDGVYNNPWSDNFASRDDHRMSNRLMDIMQATNDPRIPIYAQPTVADPTKYVGQPNSLTPARAAAANWIVNASRPGTIFYAGRTIYGTFGGAGGSYPSYMLTAAEVNFILAEAAERGLITGLPGTAASFYNTAITQSLAQWGVSASATATFLTQPGIVYTPGNGGLIQIARQKWVALYSDGGTAWTEWRRTCQPQTVVPGVDASRPNVPRRFEYTVVEYTVNKAAIDAAVTQMGGLDAFETRMYWDKSPAAAPTYPGAAICGVQNGT